MYLLGCCLRYPGKYTATRSHSQCVSHAVIYTQLITDKAYSGIYFIETIIAKTNLIPIFSTYKPIGTTQK
jgi:hypothetical protein